MAMSEDLEVCTLCGEDTDEVLICAQCGGDCCPNCEMGGFCPDCDMSVDDDDVLEQDDDIFDVEDEEDE
jgi:hypothetical protein